MELVLFCLEQCNMYILNKIEIDEVKLTKMASYGSLLEACSDLKLIL